MDRIEHYLSRLMKEQGKWVRITKLKHQRPNRENTAERQNLLKQITSTLNLMGVKFEMKTSFTLRVIKDIPSGLHLNPAPYQMVLFDDIWREK